VHYVEIFREFARVETEWIMSGTSDLELLALQNMINGSEAMFDRRRRILREARAIISQEGPEQLNMRNLGERAGVSTKTIYNAFGSKETVIALAIYTYFQSFVDHLTFETNSRDLDGAMERQATSTLRDVDVPHFMKAVIGLYFSRTVHPAIRAVLIDLATRSWSDWLQKVEDERQIRQGVVLRELHVDLSSLQYACILDWCNGSLSDEVFLRRSISGILTHLMGATTGQAYEALGAAFANLQSNTEFRDKMFSSSRDRIDAAMKNITADRRRRRTANARAVI